jgi:PASTA domain
MSGTLPGGFGAGSDILDVTGYWALSEAAVHDFAKAIDIRVGSAAANAIPAVLEGAQWRTLAAVDGTTLPGGSQDGFYRSGTDVHILTRHLSSFVLLRDVQKPRKPARFRGSNTNGRLVLRWNAATDNSGQIGSYAVYANGVKIRTVGPAARSADVGRFKTTDSRTFRMRAYDVAGNASPLTYKLVVVPSVRNLTLADAKTRLTQRGLKAGAITRIYSSEIAAGRVVSASKSGVLRVGSGVPLNVSLGPRNRPAPSGSPGSGTTGGSTSGGSTSGSGTTPPPPPPPSATPPPASPPPAPPSSGGSAEGDITTNFEATAQADDSWLRRVLGLALVGAAFILAAGALLRSRQRRQEEVAAATPIEPVLFWDTRLLQFASSTVRRLTGR